ncbi:DUF6516 family protein [Neorhizobium sp. JUb45]
MIGYDNERGKGDHKHFDQDEMPYAFSTVHQMLADFLADIRAMRKTER